MTCYEELKARGLIAQVTNEDEISKMINEGKAAFVGTYDGAQVNPASGRGKEAASQAAPPGALLIGNDHGSVGSSVADHLLRLRIGGIQRIVTINVNE